MSCDNWTYCTAVVDLTPCSSLALDVDDYATPAEAFSLQTGDSLPIGPNQRGTGM